MARRFHIKQDEETNYWLSYSDMMAGLLLCFVLIISLSVLHAKVQYDEKQTELLGKEQELIVQSDALRDERATVAAQQSLLEQQQTTLERQQTALAQQQKQITEQEETLRQQYALLDELRDIMDSQQERLDRIIGVRTELVEALKEEFDDSNLHLLVDEQTGAITFDSSILFEYNKDELKDSGKTFLAQFLPRYVNILMSPKYRQYVSEIIIEGHTDTSGGYLFNLELSQKRAFSVAEYCLSEESGILTERQLSMMQEVVTTNGKSFSNPVYTDDGEVDMEASRRVDFQFRLKDEEMIREMIEILSSDKND